MQYDELYSGFEYLSSKSKLILLIIKIYKQNQDIRVAYEAKWLLEANQKRRDQLNIIANILESTREGARKTKIMHSVNLSFVQLNDYLTFLIDNGLVRLANDGKKEVYIATIKGVLFAQMYHELISMITIQAEQKAPLISELF
jgi:predicted transcriptional regulator